MQTPYTITLDTLTLTRAHVDGSLDMSFEYEKDMITTSQVFTFYGEALRLIRDRIVCSDNPQPIPFFVTDKCCKNPDGTPFVLLDGLITVDDVTYCETADGCTLTASVTSNDIASQKRACLKNHFIWDRENRDGSITTEGENTFRAAPQTVYCNDPSLFAVITGVIFRFLVLPTFFIVALIVTVINFIIDAVNIIPGVNIDNIDFDGNDDTNTFQEAGEWINELIEAITGCGRKHKTPFVHSYLSNIAQLCGMTLKSELFDTGGILHDTMILHAATQRGDDDVQRIAAAWEQNKPNQNGEQFLDELERNFRIKTRITDDCVMCVDHEDTLNADVVPWLDMAALDADTVESFCVEPQDGKRCAFGRYEFAEDTLDTAGDSVRRQWVDSTIPWDEPPLAGQAGSCDFDLEYGAARFRDDVSFTGRETLDGFFGSFLNTGDYPNTLILEKDKAARPKLLMWDGVSDTDCALIQRVAVGNDKFEYNIPLRIHATPIQGIDTLYQTLFYSDDPRTQNGKRRKFTLTFRHTCQHVSTLRDSSVINVVYCGNVRTGTVERVTWDRASMTVTGAF